jgi:hypothetical protein
MENRERPTFIIVEGEDDFDWEEFTKDYMEMKLTKKQILEKYDLTPSKYGTRARSVQRDTGFKRPQGYTPQREYIHKNDSGSYTVNKTVDRVYKQITVNDYASARDVLEYLDRHNWTDEALLDCRRKYGVYQGWKARGFVNAPVKTDALKHYNEFKEIYFNPDYTIPDIKEELNISTHQYNVLRQELKKEIPDLVDRNTIHLQKVKT